MTSIASRENPDKRNNRQLTGFLPNDDKQMNDNKQPGASTAPFKAQYIYLSVVKLSALKAESK